MIPNTLYTPPTQEQLEEAEKMNKVYIAKYNNGQINHWQLNKKRPASSGCAGCVSRRTEI